MVKNLDKSFRRVPKGYDGTGVTSRSVSELLPHVLSQVTKAYEDKPDLVLAAWTDIIGAKLAPMTAATAFQSGVLYVKVKNSTLYSLLSQRDKPKILKRLRDRFPSLTIHNIIFRIG